MQLSPLAQYQALIQKEQIIPDDDQLAAVQALDQLWQSLSQQKPRTWWSTLSGSRQTAVHGLYLWGGVGRGKTWLMDLFYGCLPEGNKQRTHFHRFMQRVHSSLNRLGNVANPLPVVARDWAKDCKILCLDEFFVSDIADAMLLSGLLEALFQQGVTLVTTSNLHPDDLYRDGLQRARFLPAIDLIKQHTRVLELAGTTDFRLRILEQSEIYHHPLDEQAQANLSGYFDRMTAGCELSTELKINDRKFHARRRGDGLIWFDFAELCDKPRGSNDFIEIARSFNTVMISGVPQMDADQPDAARRFITLVDEFYDRGVKLLLSAAVPVGNLYTGQKLEFEFERTQSRLIEMQTHDYLARPHLS